MAGDKVQALVFGEVATEYDRVRPDYPVKLIEDMLEYSAPVKALEIGAGTGKATVAVASRGVQIVALEPDPAMALVLRQRTAGLVVNIAMGSLESYEPEEQFDLVYCAQAFHWTDPATRWARTAALLRPGGSLALFWNLEQLADAAERDAVAEAAAEYDIRAWSEWPESDEVEPDPELAGRPEFAEFRQEIYRWERTLPREDYLTNLSTQSQYRMLEDEDRDELLEQLRAALPDPVTIQVATKLYLAKRV